MRISDWSSDVCSSDLFYTIDVTFGLIGYLCVWYATGSQIRSSNDGVRAWLVCLVCYPPFFPFLSQRLGFAYKDAPNWLDWFEIGRASCRERVVSKCRSRWAPVPKKKKINNRIA